MRKTPKNKDFARVIHISTGPTATTGAVFYKSNFLFSNSPIYVRLSQMVYTSFFQLASEVVRLYLLDKTGHDWKVDCRIDNLDYQLVCSCGDFTGSTMSMDITRDLASQIVTTLATVDLIISHYNHTYVDQLPILKFQ